MDPKWVLIIDDDTALCEELLELLTDEGYFAECTQDPVKGEALIRNGNYNIILLDYRLPQLRGLDILKKLKADNIHKRIFIFSGRPYLEGDLKEENLSDMISGIIAKPINFENLLEKIKES